MWQLATAKADGPLPTASLRLPNTLTLPIETCANSTCTEDCDEDSLQAGWHQGMRTAAPYDCKTNKIACVLAPAMLRNVITSSNYNI